MSEEKQGQSKRTRGVIDRVEDGRVAVVHVGEDESLKVELPAALLPEGADSGSHLVIVVSLDEASRKETEERVKALQEKLEKRGGEGQKNFKL
jgi:hypothetical protein